MLLEYNNFTNNDIIIEVINGPYWDFILNEEYNEFKIYHIDKFHTTSLTNDQTIRLKNIEKEVDARLAIINPFVGYYNNEKTGKIKQVEFEIKPLEHWYEKFLRYDIEGSQYINPNILDGIDNIYNNRDYLAYAIENVSNGRPPLILDGDRVMLVCKKHPIYSEITFFDMEPKSNPKKYIITLQTSMKGKRYIDKEVDKTLYVCP